MRVVSYRACPDCQGDCIWKKFKNENGFWGGLWTCIACGCRMGYEEHRKRLVAVRLLNGNYLLTAAEEELR